MQQRARWWSASTSRAMWQWRTSWKKGAEFGSSWSSAIRWPRAPRGSAGWVTAGTRQQVNRVAARADGAVWLPWAAARGPCELDELDRPPW